MRNTFRIANGVAHTGFRDFRPLLPNATSSFGSAALLAGLDANFGRFPDNSDSRDIPLAIVDEGASRADFAGGQVIVRMDPKGNDTWMFILYVQIKFSNKRVKNLQTGNVKLTQDDRQKSFPFP
ncbi:hypothetical protein ACWEHA_00710 [Amycolatopsis nivea]